MKLSQWHDGSVKPKHDGVYERQYSPNDNQFSLFLNGQWHNGCYSVIAASKVPFKWIKLDNPHFAISDEQNLPWRGIVK